MLGLEYLYVAVRSRGSLLVVGLCTWGALKCWRGPSFFLSFHSLCTCPGLEVCFILGLFTALCVFELVPVRWCFPYLTLLGCRLPLFLGLAILVWFVGG